MFALRWEVYFPDDLEIPNHFLALYSTLYTPHNLVSLCHIWTPKDERKMARPRQICIWLVGGHQGRKLYWRMALGGQLLLDLLYWQLPFVSVYCYGPGLQVGSGRCSSCWGIPLPQNDFCTSWTSLRSRTRSYETTNRVDDSSHTLDFTWGRFR